jgi:hypothetical protein
MEREDHSPGGLTSLHDWKDAALEVLKAIKKYPAWATIFILTEIIGAVDIHIARSNGVLLSSDEIEARIRLATLVGMLAGGSIEVLMSAGKWLVNRHKSYDS